MILRYNVLHFVSCVKIFPNSAVMHIFYNSPSHTYFYAMVVNFSASYKISNLFGYTFYLFCCLFSPECEELDAPQFGSINCSLGDDGVPTPGDTCSFSCDDGYNIGTTTMTTCNDKGNWAPSLPAECVIGKFYYSIKFKTILHKPNKNNL